MKDWRHEGRRVGIIRREQALEIICIGRKAVPPFAIGRVEIAYEVGCVGKSVFPQIRVVGCQLGSKSPAPVFVNLKPAAAEKTASEIVIRRRARRSCLRPGRGCEGFDFAALETLPVFALIDRAFLGGEARNNRRVLVRADRPVIGNFDLLAEFRRAGKTRWQEAGLPLYRRIGL